VVIPELKLEVIIHQAEVIISQDHPPIHQDLRQSLDLVQAQDHHLVLVEDHHHLQVHLFQEERDKTIQCD